MFVLRRRLTSCSSSNPINAKLQGAHLPLLRTSSIVKVIRPLLLRVPPDPQLISSSSCITAETFHIYIVREAYSADGWSSTRAVMRDVCSASPNRWFMRKDARNVKIETEESELDIIFCVFVLNGHIVGGGRVDVVGDHVGSSECVDHRQ